jgi:ribosomal protein S26
MIVEVNSKTVECDRCGRRAPAHSPMGEHDDNVRKFAAEDDRFKMFRGRDYCSGCALLLEVRRRVRRPGRRE